VISRYTHNGNRDWFLVDNETAKSLHFKAGDFVLPQLGLVKKPGGWAVHRSHLPLANTSEALDALSKIEPKHTWAERDARTQALGFKLRTNQQSGLDFVEPRRGSLVADDMRSGKTALAVMAHNPLSGQLVVVAPLSARGVWLGWLRRIFPDTSIGVCVGKQLQREEIIKPIVFVHYEIVKHWQVLMPIGTLVLDEAHYVVGKDTKRAMAVALMASRAHKVIALTGTPIWDKPPDLWNVIGMLAPGAWGSYYDFATRYGAPEATAYGTKFSGISNQDELRTRMSEVMIRRLWKDIQDLPPISRSVIVAEVDDPTRKRLDILAGKLRSERTNTAGNLAHYRSQLCKFKLKTVLAEASKIASRGEPCVVWTWHKQFADDIAEALGERGHLIHGEIPVDKREERIAAWKAKPNDVLVATMAVGQVAIDLSHAHLAIFAELDYTPAIIGQAEMRTFSPLRPMHVTFVMANHVIDQRIVRALVSKLNASDPLGLAAAIDAIEAVRLAVEGPQDEPDMVRFFDDLLANDS
jgi:SNF2 family DNA or RNA helicase